MQSGEDHGLRLLALKRLGALTQPLAREALEGGTMAVEPNIVVWHGSLGMVHGHLVVLWLEPEMCARVLEQPSIVDALTAAIASAVASVSGHALAELKIFARAPGPSTSRSTAYRGRV